MRVYQEIDALRTMNINPIHYLVLPRLVAISTADSNGRTTVTLRGNDLALIGILAAADIVLGALSGLADRGDRKYRSARLRRAGGTVPLQN